MFSFLTLAFTAAALLSSRDAVITEQAADSGVTVHSLSELPNMTIRYYDVVGDDVASINKSIVKQRPLVGGRPLVASVDWTVNASFRKRTRNAQCKIEDVQVSFAAQADLPRLANEHQLKAPFLKQWHRYVEGLQANELPTLAFVYSQLDAVRDAVLASRCEQAKATAAAAVEGLKAHAAAFELARQKQARRTEQMFADAGLFDTPTAKPICKGLAGTGSRLNRLRVCMLPREWELLHRSGEEATRELQDVRRPNAPF